MARRNNGPISDSDKAKVRVLFAEVEGNNESIQEALKAMLSAVGRPVRVVSDSRTDGNSAPLLEQAHVDVIEEGADSAEEGDEPRGEAAASITRKPRRAGKKDRNAGLEWVPDLNFRPIGQQTLKEFVNEKGPKNDLEVCLAVVHYMQHIMKLPKSGPESRNDSLQRIWQTDSRGYQADYTECEEPQDLVEF